ncbi:hypothetical protein A2715_03925 [Candidatus Woesebacteria bacterium RIFCSPHIGHO2_01_FULL_39_32]|uniref:Uncharacterized protein n=1 Tax=Candidatus Woesebacteria bacterium RIFCSPLOWO2_01_FULL_39_25 TaxID=1802521 RepID=A0A1F8BIU7_9BACT|nr:MAG: hypothetical protein A2715_03925 [Candidatus Woesebacteria bacterium RIFCSPHIGHO2_01_FULL_39_32]OGM35529.1 MAG: hypothetical protein A3F01_05035 [Candidatus Woesebacteria bacterium RIFCSPHIGHO2_12_FULL_38_11]OGM63977.1 MAG: hypothetical protein A2893_00515 [Candidatus Woesebacteria bacterium RIFCSPLOWO2_01_FULL_39_25]
MRKFLLILFSIITFYLLSSSFVSSPVFAQVTDCDPVTGLPCTYCYPVDDANPSAGCRVDFNLSSCNLAGYFPDPNLCNTLTFPCMAGQPAGNCLEAPVCDNEGDTCTGTVGTQGSCCDGFVCNNVAGNLTCTTPASCGNLDDPCTGPPGTQDGCCSGLVCNNYAGGGANLKCQEPPAAVTGYFCETAGLCLPCYATSTNFGCAPPEYADYTSCDQACSGGVPLKYACIPGVGCNESGTGTYGDLALCEAACKSIKASPIKIFCDKNGKPCDTPGIGDCTAEIYTAIGCIPITEQNAFARFVILWGIGIVGGIALILIIYAGFMIITSGGNPQRLQAGKELLTAAVMGVVLLLFGAYILNLIGVEILKIPGLK